MFLDLTVTDKFLLLNKSLYPLLLLSLFPSEILLVLADNLKVVKVILLSLLLSYAVVSHLLLQLLLHSLLILADTRLHCVLFLLKLLHIVHNNLGPVVRVL